jgi:hypothetical protein
MEDKPATPPLDDVRFFQDIAAGIRGRPEYYRDAGEWLDENYSDAAFEKMERAERKERLRKAKAGQTPEAKAVIEGLSKLRPDKSGTMQPDEAFGLIVPYARQKLGMSEERFAELEAKARTGHLAPDADLRPLTAEEKARWPAMSEADRQELRSRMALTTEQKKQRDTEREELYAVYTERDRLIGLVKRYYLGDGLPYHVIKLTYRKRVRKSFLMLRRFHSATLPFHKDPPAFPTVTESKRILLMTWLMTDPQANESGLGLTEFEKWPWDAAGQDRVHGRRYASNWWLFPSTGYSSWIALARRAWETATEEQPAVDNGAPFYKPSYFTKWNIGDELLRRNGTDEIAFTQGKVRRKRQSPSGGELAMPAKKTAKKAKKGRSTKGKPRPVYWYSEPDTRKRWPDRFAATTGAPPKS